MAENDTRGKHGGDYFASLDEIMATLPLDGDDGSSTCVTDDLQDAGAVHVGSEPETFRPSAPGLSAMDVADYILRARGPMSTMKLQKLVYYCQAWSLVWDEARLFHEEIEAWANGPVVRELFNLHRGMFKVERVPVGNPDRPSETQRETIDAVLGFYGNKTAQWLIDLSHSEPPWQQARRGLPETERGCRPIPDDSMANYYSSLLDS